MSYIISIGTAVPANAYTQQALAEFVADYSQIDVAQISHLYQRTRIAQRHSVLPDFDKNETQKILFKAPQVVPDVTQRMQLYQSYALPLAQRAVENCLQKTNYSYASITHLITVSCTGMVAPGLEIQLIQHLGLSPSVVRLPLNFIGCYAALPAQRLAHTICQANPHAKVLLVCVELCSLHFQPVTDAESMVNSSLFADGAAAMLVSAAPEKNVITQQFFQMRGFHSKVLPQTHQEMTWRITANGFLMTLSAYIPELLKSDMGSILSELLALYELETTDITHWAVHPGGKRILEALQIALHLPETAFQSSYQVLRQFGNMSSATVLFVLLDLLQHQRFTSNARIFSSAFGPGLSIESALYQVMNA